MMHHPRVGIGVLILDSQNRLLLGQRKNAHGNETWGPPGGHLEFGESFESCARREILEETGLLIGKTFYLNLTNDVFIQEQRHYISIFMIGRCPKEQHPQACEPHKTASWQWFELDKLPVKVFLPMQNLFTKIEPLSLSQALQEKEERAEAESTC